MVCVKVKKWFIPSGPCITTQVIPGLVIYGVGGGPGKNVDYDLGYTLASRALQSRTSARGTRITPNMTGSGLWLYLGLANESWVANMNIYKTPHYCRKTTKTC